MEACFTALQVSRLLAAGLHVALHAGVKDAHSGSNNLGRLAVNKFDNGPSERITAQINSQNIIQMFRHKSPLDKE